MLDIDGVKSYTYEFHSQNKSTYNYNVPVFSIHDLDETSHTASISLQEESQFFFDYLIYTTVESPYVVVLCFHM